MIRYPAGVVLTLTQMRISESYRKKGRSPVVFSNDVMESITQDFITTQPSRA